MNQLPLVAIVALVGGIVGVGPKGQRVDASDAYLDWTASKARQVGGSTRVTGQAGSSFDFRITSTDQSFNYKLRATWMTGSVIRAAARLAQLSDGLTADQTRALVSEAQGIKGITILIEIDPREGSGVLPLEWSALLGLRPLGQASPSVRGKSVPSLGKVRALSGVFRRDYSYEAFWLVFPDTTDDGKPIFSGDRSEVELVVRIYNKEGRVKWPTSLVLGPDSRTGSR